MRRSEVTNGQLKAKTAEDELRQARQLLGQSEEAEEKLEQVHYDIQCQYSRLSEEMRSEFGLSKVLQKFWLATSETIAREKNLGECRTTLPRNHLLVLQQDLLDSYHHILSDDMQTYRIPERCDSQSKMSMLQVTYLADTVCTDRENQDYYEFMTFFNISYRRP